MRHRAAAADWLGHLGVAARARTASSSPTVPRGPWRSTLLALARPGDTVLTEALCYSRPAQPGRPARPASRAGRHGRARDRARGAGGGRAAARAPGSWWSSPNLHNPTAILMPTEHAARRSSPWRASSICCWSRTTSTARWCRTGRRRWRPWRRSARSTSPACRSSWHRVCGWASCIGPGNLVRQIVAAQRELSLGSCALWQASCSPAPTGRAWWRRRCASSGMEMAERQRWRASC